MSRKEIMGSEQTIGANTRRLRKQADKSIYELALEAGTVPGYWYQIEQGRANPTIKKIDQIAQTLGVTTVELFSEHDADRKPRRKKTA